MCAWSTPRTWTAGETVTASIMNTHVRDNLLETAPAKSTAAGAIPYATAANSLSALAIGTSGMILQVNTGATAPQWVASPWTEAVIELGPAMDFVTTGYNDAGGDLLWTSANWRGTIAWYFEAVLARSGSSEVYAQLYDETDSGAVANSVVSVTSTSYTRARSAAITLTNAHTYRVQTATGTGGQGAGSAVRLIGVRSA